MPWWLPDPVPPPSPIKAHVRRSSHLPAGRPTSYAHRHQRPWLTLNYPILRIRHLEQFLASVLGYRRTSRQPSHAALIALAFAGPDIVVAVTRTGVCHVLDLCKVQISAK